MQTVESLKQKLAETTSSSISMSEKYLDILRQFNTESNQVELDLTSSANKPDYIASTLAQQVSKTIQQVLSF